MVSSLNELSENTINADSRAKNNKVVPFVKPSNGIKNNGQNLNNKSNKPFVKIPEFINHEIIDDREPFVKIPEFVNRLTTSDAKQETLSKKTVRDHIDNFKAWAKDWAHDYGIPAVACASIIASLFATSYVFNMEEHKAKQAFKKICAEYNTGHDIKSCINNNMEEYNSILEEKNADGWVTHTAEEALEKQSEEMTQKHKDEAARKRSIIIPSKSKGVKIPDKKEYETRDDGIYYDN